MLNCLVALIDEESCIGCGKCIRVCPTDAIVGARHTLHTVLPKYCTSCENCVNACPTNCISLKTPAVMMSEVVEERLISKKRARISAHLTVGRGNVIQPGTATLGGASHRIVLDKPNPAADLSSRKQLVADAIARAKARRNKI